MRRLGEHELEKMNGKPKLFGPEYSTYTRTVRLALAEKGVDYELVEVDFLRGEGAKPAHLARHPFGKVPVFQYCNFSVYETGAILQFIEDTFEGPHLVPDGPRERAQMNQMVGVLRDYVYPPVIGTIVIQRLVFPIIGRDMNSERISKALPSARKALGVVDNLMGENDFLAGSDITLADLYLIPMYDYFSLTPEGTEMLPEFYKLSRWWIRMKERASVVETIATPE